MSSVYVATKWSRRAEAQAVMARLKAAGHVITHDWTNEDEMEGASSAARDIHFMACAEADVTGVAFAEYFLLLHDPAARGAYVELGVAIACGVRVIVVSDGEGDPALSCPIFYWLPQVRHVKTVGEALALIR